MRSVHDFYERGPYAGSEARLVKPSFRRVLSLFRPGGCAAFLDIGCGDGTYTAAIRDHIGAQSVFGVDISAQRLRFAEEKGIVTKAANVDEAPLDFDGRTFDCIYSGELIEHVFSPDLLLENIARLLKPTGYAVLTTPNLASWRNRLALLVGWQPFWSEVSTRAVVGNPRMRGAPSGHIRLFTPRALQDLASRYGFRIEQMNGLAYVQDVPPDDAIAWLADCVDVVVPRMFPELGDGMAVRLCRAH